MSKATESQKRAMEALLAAIKAANEASATFDQVEGPEAAYLRIIAGISPNVDRTEVGKPVLSQAKINDLEAAVASSTTSREQAASTIALLAKVGVSVMKAMA